MRKKSKISFKDSYEKVKKLFDIHPFWSGIKFYSVGIYNKLDEDHIWVMSSGIAFNIVICAIPFTLILLTIAGVYLGSTNAGSAIDAYLDNIVGITPALKEKIKMATLDKIYELQDFMTITGVIGISGLMWTASSLFGTIRVVLNRVYKVIGDYPFWKGKLYDFGMVILVVVAFLLSQAATILLSVIENLNAEIFSGNFSFINDTLGFIVPIMFGLFFSFIMFYIVFKLVPHGRINKEKIRVSTISTTIMYESLKVFFLVYLARFTNISVVYGTYAAIVAVILWIYYSAFIFVLGAEFGQLYYEKLKKSK